MTRQIDETVPVRGSASALPPANAAANDPPKIEGANQQTSPTPTGRVVAVDFVRALALFGMFTINLGAHYAWLEDGVPAVFAELPHGRSSATFAVLAGFSLALLSGARSVKVGRERRQAIVKIAIRGVILIVLGTALVSAGATIPLILISYGMFFLLALPFVRLKLKGLIIAAAIVAIVGPVITRYYDVVIKNEWLENYVPYDPIILLGRLFSSAFGGVLSSWDETPTLHGYEVSAVLFYAALYPAGAFMAYVLAGMALGRLDLRARAVQVKLAIIGPALMVAGYGTSWLLAMTVPNVVGPFHTSTGAYDFRDKGRWDDIGWDAIDPGEDRKVEMGRDLDPDEYYKIGGYPRGGLLDGDAHSGTTFEILGNIGLAISLVVLMTVAFDRLSWLRRLLTPVIAAGSMTLTAYVIQAIVLSRVFGDLDRSSWLPNTTQELVWLMVGVVIFAFAWSRFFRRGPLEYLMYNAGKVAKLTR
jgi:uncharacterized membrane protein YeiB